MTMFCALEDLHNESDVEQKLAWKILTSDLPRGCSFTPADIRTKPNIKSLLIGKGDTRKLYFPDYVIVLAGLPVLIVEAKAPDQDLLEGHNDARLYAAELNAEFRAQFNPCTLVMAINGKQLLLSSWDSTQPGIVIEFKDIDFTNPEYDRLLKTIGRPALQQIANTMLDRITVRPYHRAVDLLGGQSVRNEEIGHNTFGASLSSDYRHIFNPQSLNDRALVVRHAYVPSKRRQQYVEPIDRIIRHSLSPAISHIPGIEDTSEPTEILTKLQQGDKLHHQVMLIVGGVGSGKTTFVDYLREVALQRELLMKTVWVHMNLNPAPVSKEHIYNWALDEICRELRSSIAETDWDAIETLRKVYGVELRQYRKGPLALLKNDPTEYNRRLANKLEELQKDHSATAKALARFVCADRGKLLIIVLDNCDKRVRDEQLLMFEVAQWLQNEFVALVVMPIRDVTYDHHRHEPPLDTALKDLVFRIEPPMFSEVLARRVKLALTEMTTSGARTMSYTLTGGIEVEYPATDLGMYLASILKSLYAYDKFIRRMITGIAGRDVRRAMEVFLDFCTSGYIDEVQILQIRRQGGDHVLPYAVVSRVLLRLNRRFYDGNHSWIKNLFQCVPTDPHPDNTVRLAMLRWLNDRWKQRGPTGIAGYHPVGTLARDLVALGHDANRVRADAIYLLGAGCIVAEHQRTDSLEDADLVAISASGVIHLELSREKDYLAACAEDVWFNDAAVAERVAKRIGEKGLKVHLQDRTQLINAYELISYLNRLNVGPLPRPDLLVPGDISDLNSVDAMEELLRDALTKAGMVVEAWEEYAKNTPIGSVVEGTIIARIEYGVIVRLKPGVSGFVHVSKFNGVHPDDLFVGKGIRVRVLEVSKSDFRAELECVSE